MYVPVTITLIFQNLQHSINHTISDSLNLLHIDLARWGKRNHPSKNDLTICKVEFININNVCNVVSNKLFLFLTIHKS